MIHANKQTTEQFSREAVWLTHGNTSLFTWLYLPTQKPMADIGFVLCPPLGHEYVHTYRTYRKLAEALASQGIPVIRFDLHGAGNSNGDALDLNRLAVWQQNIVDQINFLKERTGIQQVGLFGIRMGASLALKVCGTLNIDQLIVWRPILKGKQYVRELTALSKFSSSNNSDQNPFIESGGFVISQQTLADLESMEFSESSALKVDRVLEISDNNQSSDKLKKIFSVEDSCERFSTTSYDAMMAEPQIAETPDDVIDKVVSWALASLPHQKSKAAAKKTKSAEKIAPQNFAAVLSEDTFRETALFINEKLFAILGEPLNSHDDKKTIVILGNSGAVHTVGPNRLYAELVRNLLKQGYSTLRLDLHNIGDSVVGTVDKDGFPYPAEAKAVQDIFDTAEYLKNHFPQHKIIVAGVCSGSYWAFKSATKVDKGLIEKILIINPLTFDWTTESVLEDPKDQGAVRAKIHYMNSAKSKEKWIKLLKGQVDFKKLFFAAFNMAVIKIKTAGISLLETLNLLPTKKLAAELVAIKAKGIDIHFIFSSLDPGYDLLTMSGGAKIKKMMRRREFSVDFIRDADHTFSKSVHRQELLEKIIKKQL